MRILSEFGLLGSFGALAVGVVLGLMGGGGSILAVPVLHFWFKLEGAAASFHSLFIVGLTSAMGVLPFAKRQLVQFRTALYFFALSLVGVAISRRILLPALPATMSFGSSMLSRDNFILLAFAAVMVAAGASMLRKKKDMDPNLSVAPPRFASVSIQSLMVGLLTGFVGAGGGFLILPVLVNGLKVSMQRAVGTSLLIIALNSLFGFFVDAMSGFQIEWSVMVRFLVFAGFGVILGTKINPLIPPQKLRVAFGVIVLLVAASVVRQSFNS